MTGTELDPRKINSKAVHRAEGEGLGKYDAYPLRVTLELTAECNLRCPHCEFTPPRAWRDRHDPDRILHLALSDLERFAADVFPYIVEVVPSVVGEPMTYPYWDQFLDLLEKYGVYMELVTNGTYLDETTLSRLTSNTSRILISMDGASRETYNHLRKPDDFDEAIGRLAKVGDWRAALQPEQRPFVSIVSVLTTHWVDELVKMVRLAKEYRIDDLSVCHVIAPSKYWADHHPRTESERTDRALREAGEEAARLGVTVILPRLFSTGEDVSYRTNPAFAVVPKVVHEPRPEKPKHWCKYIWRELFISLGAEVAPCCGPGRPEVDNLRLNYDLKGIFMNPVLVGMREGMVTGQLHPACAKCPQLAMWGELDYESCDFTGKYGVLKATLDKERKTR